MKKKEKLIIGITGGIGAGKTTLANLIKDKGYNVIFTDELAKKTINENNEIQTNLIKEFGKDCFIDGKYNAKYVSDIVFSDNKKLEKLNKIVIPNVIDDLIAEIDLLQDADTNLIFVESALLYEFDLADGFDYIISVTAKLENKKNRIKHNFQDRIASQMQQEEKNALADFVIENDKDISELKKSLEFIIDILEVLPNKE